MTKTEKTEKLQEEQNLSRKAMQKVFEQLQEVDTENLYNLESHRIYTLEGIEIKPWYKPGHRGYFRIQKHPPSGIKVFQALSNIPAIRFTDSNFTIDALKVHQLITSSIQAIKKSKELKQEKREARQKATQEMQKSLFSHKLIPEDWIEDSNDYLHYQNNNTEIKVFISKANIACIKVNLSCQPEQTGEIIQTIKEALEKIN